MTKKLTALGMTLFLVVTGAAACGASEDKEVPQSTQIEEQENTEHKMESKEEQMEIDKAIQKMKEEGILDENGQPAPGVDLRNYPGLG